MSSVNERNIERSDDKSGKNQINVESYKVTITVLRGENGNEMSRNLSHWRLDLD
jgi:hypothetical protein